MILRAGQYNEGFGSNIIVLVNGVEMKMFTMLDTETGDCEAWDLKNPYEPILVSGKLNKHDFLELRMRKQF